MQTLEIFEPKYKTNCCLIAVYKVNQIQNDFIVVFTKAKHLMGKKFLVKYSDCLDSEVVTNGKIDCYAVPMEKLTEIMPQDEVKTKAKNTRKSIIQKYIDKILNGINFALDNKNNFRITSEITNYISILTPILEDLAEYKLRDIIIKLYGIDSEQLHKYDEFISLTTQ